MFEQLQQLLPFLQDPVVRQEEKSKAYITTGTFLGLEIVSTGFTLEDSLNNYNCQLEKYLVNLFEQATDPSSSSTFLALLHSTSSSSFSSPATSSLPSTSTSLNPQTLKLKSKKLALDRSFDAIEKAMEEGKSKNESYISLLFTYAMKNKLPTPQFSFFVERNLYGCEVEFVGSKFTFEALYAKKNAVKEAICKHVLKCLIENESK